MTALWDQLSFSEPNWHDDRDAIFYASERDEFRVYQFTVALNDEFETVRSFLLHRDPFPNLDTVVTELCAEKAHASLKSQQSILSTETVLATHASSPSQHKVTCRYCHKPKHLISECFKLQSKQGTGRYNQSKYKTDKASTYTTAATIKESYSGDLSSLNELLSQVDLDTLKQALAQSLTNAFTSSALSITPGKSLSSFFDSACCNHMIADSRLFKNKNSILLSGSLQENWDMVALF